ncbi:hypothetical protein V9T40_007480 [Parthenolecanium corni]|uniref:Uncharacterized protein n=1 Tax=Parthenolecanium corni TaxID=536013 RepID=A0AAN9TJZ0_9HEMI
MRSVRCEAVTERPSSVDIGNVRISTEWPKAMTGLLIQNGLPIANHFHADVGTRYSALGTVTYLTVPYRTLPYRTVPYLPVLVCVLSELQETVLINTNHRDNHDDLLINIRSASRYRVLINSSSSLSP